MILFSLVLPLLTFAGPANRGPLAIAMSVPRQRPIDLVVMLSYAAGVVFCLTSSVLFHTFHDHSEKIAASLHRLDFVGVAILIWAHWIPFLEYAFTCKPGWRLFYQIAITATAFGGGIWSLCDKRQSVRTCIFLALGWGVMCPLGQLIFTVTGCDRARLATRVHGNRFSGTAIGA